MPAKRIGIFAFGTSPIDHMPPPLTRAMLAEAAFRNTELLFFSAADCDTGTGTVDALRFAGTGWEQSRAGVPPVVMILTDPVRPRHLEVDGWLRRKASVIAERGPDKLELARLMEGSALACYVIPYALLAAVEVEAGLTESLRSHGAIVVKPVDGMRGGGIQFIHSAANRWTLQRMDGTTTASLEEIVADAARSIAGRMRYRDYIVQRFIDSKSPGGLPMALRLDLHKRAGGVWHLIREVGRVGVFGKLTTNLASGGAQMLIQPFLAVRTKRPPADIRDEAMSLAHGVAALIDGNPAFSLSQLGVDILIDPDDRLWLIEANSYPMATWVEHERAIALIDYALSLLPMTGAAATDD